jgi:hypothetical protein
MDKLHLNFFVKRHLWNKNFKGEPGTRSVSHKLEKKALSSVRIPEKNCMNCSSQVRGKNVI